ncbi:MAG: amidohydrolase [Gammaproteobacteria bacterium]|nr:amidohydrolase [Gammaproteobacteria bacterium]
MVELRRIDDPDAVDALVRLFLAVLGSEGAPTAADEIEVLTGRAAARVEFVGGEAGDGPAIDAVADFLRREPPADATGPRRRPRPARRHLRGLRHGGGTARSGGARRAVGARRRRGAFRSEFAIGRTLRWFSLFRRYRHVLVDSLANMYAEQGMTPALIAPALVDYSRWLEERPRSPIHDQVRVMGLIAARADGPAVHGYVAYDPLHEVYFRSTDAETRAAMGYEPVLDIVAEALDAHGFLGVKLYPPMGFRPAGNADEGVYPRRVIDDIGNGVGAELDRALDDLYRVVGARGACIIAHGADSNAAGEGFGSRGDPAHWLAVFRRHPALKVCIAHFGGFDAVSAAPVGPEHPENSWEWTLGAWFEQYRQDFGGEAPVFGDISYYSEVLAGSGEDRARYAALLASFIDRFDPECLHLVYGSDWMMLGAERGHESYARTIESFLANDVGLDADRVERIMSGNACRLFGPADGDPARDRLERFYETHGLDPSRLPGCA